MPREQVDNLIARIARRQYGLISRDQTLALGATKAFIRVRLEARRWEPIHRGIYRIAGSPAGWEQALLASCLACGPLAAASHAAAGAVWKLPAMDAGIVEMSVPRDGPRCRGFAVHRVELAREDVTVHRGIPVTKPARTLIDIAGVLSREVVEEALDDALRRRLVTRSRLRWRIDALARKGRPGITVMRSLLAAREDGGSVPQSVFETRMLRVLRRGRLPPPTLQYEVRDKGRLVAVVDFAFPDARLAIETDGYRWHSGRARWQRDLARRNMLTELGWQVFHITWTDLKDRPEAVVASIAKTLSERTLRTSTAD